MKQIRVAQKFVGLIVLLCLGLGSSPETAFAEEWQFGFSKIDITPTNPIRLSGYASRQTPFDGVDEKLHVRAMAMRTSPAGEFYIIVSVETIGFPAEVTNQVIAKIKPLGVSREQLAICVTHCHTAPHILPGLDNLFAPALNVQENEAIRAYTQMVVDKTAEAIDQAMHDLQPGRFSIATGKAVFARNRRVLKDGIWIGFGENADGPVDHSLPVIRITDPTGTRTRGLLFNYACHCTTFGGEYNRVNGDWAGYAATYLEASNEGAFALCTIGCGADANPQRDAGRALELAQAQGKQISEEVNRLLGGNQWREIAIAPTASLGFAGLPIDRPSDERLQDAMEGSNPHARRHAQVMMETKQRMGRLPETYPMPIQVWRFGNEFAMVFLGGEVVVDYAARIKQELSSISGIQPEQIWVSAYTNDVFGYVASERMRSEGGYEVDFSMIYYLIPGRWSTGTEEVIIKRVTELFSNKKIAKPLDVDAAIQTFALPEGFQITPLVSEPLVQDPINFAVDARGRLWVVEMGDYPRGAPHRRGPKSVNPDREPWDGEPGGRIKIITDSDSDGRYDTASVFLEGLTFPTGVFPWKDGAIISAAPDIIFARDQDNDGFADSQEVLYSGFEKANPQHRVNGFTYGLDGWLYLSGGTHNHQIKCLKTGQTVRLSGRDIRIHPESGAAEPVAGNSQFGRCQDSLGNWYGNTNSEPLFQLVIEDRFLGRNPYVKSPSSKHFLTQPVLNPFVFPTSRTLDRFNDLHTMNRFTSACSPLVFRNDALGAPMQSSALICEPVHNLVSRIQLQYGDVAVSGSRIPQELQSEFLTSTDNWFRPVRLMTGPDGGLWICDMYREVIEHPEWIPEAWQTSLDLYAGSDMGRIYRVTRQGQKVHRLPDFSKLSNTGLVDQLRSSNGWNRDMAQQLLVERFARNGNGRLKPDESSQVDEKWTLAAIENIVRDSSLSIPIRIQAVWTGSLLQKQPVSRQADLLTDGDPYLVANALRALTFDFDALRELLTGNSPTRLHPAVQVEVALAANQFDPEEKKDILSTLASMNVGNKWIRAAILSSAVGVAEPTLMELLKRVPVSTGRSSLAEGLIDTVLAKDLELGFIKIAELAEPADKAFEDWQLVVLSTCLDHLRRKGQPYHELNNPTQGLKSAIVTANLAISQALVIADSLTEPDDRRKIAIRLLGHAKQSEDEAKRLLMQLLSPRSNLEIQSAAVDSLASLECAQELISLIPNCGPTIQNEIQTRLLSRPSWTMALLKGVKNGIIQPGHLNPATSQALLTHRRTDIQSLATELIGAPSTSSERQSIVEKYVKAFSHKGASDQGRTIFKQHCASCHQHRGVGQNIAPNLSALEGKNDEYLIRSILDPNAAMEWKYKSYLVLTVDGRTSRGMVLEESATSLIMASADGQQEVILLSDIEEMKNSSLSFMPEGFEKAITPGQMVDLLAFIKSN